MWLTGAISFDGHDVAIGTVAQAVEGVDVELVGGPTQQAGEGLGAIGRTRVDLLPHLVVLLVVNHKTYKDITD